MKHLVLHNFQTTPYRDEICNQSLCEFNGHLKSNSMLNIFAIKKIYVLEIVSKFILSEII